MQMQTFLLSTNVVDDCRKHACVTDASHTHALTVDIYFKCAHGPLFYQLITLKQ